MGGTETKVRTLNQRLNYKYDKTNIDELDRVSIKISNMKITIYYCMLLDVLRRFQSRQKY